MANRSNVTSNFEAVSPPWSLATLDGYLNALAGTLNESSLGLVNTGTDTGTANNYIISTLSFGSVSAYNQGLTVGLIPANVNTGPSTITIGLLGSVPILDVFGNPILAGTLMPGAVHPLIYIGSSFRMIRNRASVSWETIHTPTFNVWNTIGVWNIEAGTSSLVSYNISTFIFTLNANCLVQLNMENGNTNFMTVALSNLSGGVLPASAGDGGVSPSSDFQQIPIIFFAPVNGQFSVSDISFNTSPPPSGTNFTLVFSAV